MTESSAKQTIAQFLVSLALKMSVLFHTPEGEAYATFPIGEYQDTAQIDSETFIDWLIYQFFKETREAASPSAIRDASRNLAALAIFEGKEEPVFYRYAFYNGFIYVDLGNTKREQIEITPDGWHVIAAKKSPIKFVRKRGMASLVNPERGGSLNGLRPFFRFRSEDDFVLMVGWAVGVMNPQGPFPILIFQGPQGSSKSTSCRFLQSIIDPSYHDLGSMPRSERNFSIAAYNTYLLALDNQSGIHPDVSDLLCRLSTGGHFRCRKLHSDTDEILMYLKKPAMMNGITDIVTRHDLADRSIVIQTKSSMSKLEREPERDLYRKWGDQKPYILGAIYDALVTALRNRDKIKTPQLPRMADFAKFVTEAESALPFRQGAFLEALALNSERRIDAAIEADLVAIEVLKMIETEPNYEWSGTAEELRLKLNSQTDEQIQKQKEWPKIANRLSNLLKRCEVPLKEKGVEIEFKHSGNRTITIRRVDKNTVHTDLSVPENYLPDGDKGPGNNNGASGASQLSYLGGAVSEGNEGGTVDTNNDTYIEGEI